METQGRKEWDEGLSKGHERTFQGGGLDNYLDYAELHECTLVKTSNGRISIHVASVHCMSINFNKAV